MRYESLQLCYCQRKAKLWRKTARTVSRSTPREFQAAGPGWGAVATFFSGITCRGSCPQAGGLMRPIQRAPPPSCFELRLSPSRAAPRTHWMRIQERCVSTRGCVTGMRPSGTPRPHHIRYVCGAFDALGGDPGNSSLRAWTTHGSPLHLTTACAEGASLRDM